MTPSCSLSLAAGATKIPGRKTSGGTSGVGLKPPMFVSMPKHSLDFYKKIPNNVHATVAPVKAQDLRSVWGQCCCNAGSRTSSWVFLMSQNRFDCLDRRGQTNSRDFATSCGPIKALKLGQSFVGILFSL